MNKALMEARKKFKNQKGKISTGYDNSNLPEGKYVCKISQSEIGESKKGKGDCVHLMRLVVDNGDHKGRSLWPFKNDLTDVKGVLSVAKNIRAILGDVVPGRQDTTTNEFELDYDKFLAAVEGLAHECIGVMVEVTVKDNRKGKKKEDGSYWQSTYINRALGEDANAVAPKQEEKRSIHSDGDDLNMGGGSAQPKRKVVKRG